MTTRLLPALLLLFCATAASAQPTRTLTDDDWCDRTNDWSSWGDGGRYTACEVRETVLSTDRLSVEGSNGGITVRPWDRSDVLVRARVAARGPSQSEADRRVRETDLDVGRGSVRAKTPRGRNVWVAVSYEVFAPARTALALRTQNGGVSVEGTTGRLDAQTQNGGVALRGVSGAVRARTQNGGITVDLARRSRAGLDLKTQNGGITVSVPDGYSANLTASTRVGRIATPGFDLPRERAERGRYAVGDRVEARLGGGGPPLSVETTNGSITIRRDR